MLQVNNIDVSYGSIHAIHNVSLHVKEGEVVSLIGANGAGKTTILSTISGLKRPDTGEIVLRGNNIVKIDPHKIVTMGMAHIPEGRRIFSQLTVEENLEMGAYIVKNKATMKAGIENAFEMFPRLKERRRQLAGTLSGGEQQMLAIGRALMCNPDFLLMDEPSMGLAPLLVKEIFEIIKRLNKEGMTILLVEQNAKMALSVADRGYVLETGRIVLEGTGEDLLVNEDVKKAYLGA